MVVMGDWSLCWHVGKTSSFSCIDNMCGGAELLPHTAPALTCTSPHYSMYTLPNVRTLIGCMLKSICIDPYRF